MANDAELKALAGQISEVMLSEKMTVTTAESCIGDADAEDVAAFQLGKKTHPGVP